MPPPAYALGIDLGTTNSALAAVRLAGAEASRVLPIPQWVGVGQVDERTTLPSFLYRPLEHERAGFAGGPGMIDDWVVGVAAREQSVRTPGRVVLSAKSWLASHAGDLEATRLPWKSDALAPGELITPLAASAASLRHLRQAWEAAHPEAPLAEQSITVTVPASFDAAAQGATLEAARRAGFPATVRLLEEPQAAFYRWLERSGATGSTVPELAAGEQVLVVDVGGGTSDFSLFRLGEEAGEGSAAIERVAVSEHILLGGDNIDLALAHFLEAQLLPGGGQIEGDSWNHLVARARDLKERSLAAEAAETDQRLPVAVPGRGSGLLAGTLSAEVAAAEVREIVLEGFFPACPREARPQVGRSGLQEWGLPYAADFAVTRYLADFLREHPPVDAVLFNGGTLAAPVLRERLLEQIATWQGGAMPVVLANPETDLAVAHGAAHYGAVLAGRGRRIEAGAARAVFLEVAGAGETADLLCVLPRGAAPGTTSRVELPGLRVRLNTRVQFRAFQGAHRRAESAGDVVPWASLDFHELPPLATTVERPGDATEAIPVVLESALNELGLLQVELVSPEQRWPLAFNLRGASEAPSPSPAPPVPDVVEVDEARAAAALEKLRAELTGRRSKKGDKLTSARLLKQLERRLELPRMEWPLPLVRRLGDQLLADAALRDQSPEHLEAWLYLVGWALRPGFGEGRDAERIDRLWSLLAPSHFPIAKRTEPPFSLLWRRLAGGLTAARQADLFDARIELWSDARRAPPEGIRLAGALERLDLARKEQLVSLFLDRAVELAEADQHPAPYLAALGGLLTRVPLREAGAVVVGPEAVERAWERLAPLDWSAPAMANVVPLFLQAARRVERDEQNVSARLGRRLADRLDKVGVAAPRLQPLRAYVPLAAGESAARYEEALPPGLVLQA